MNKYQLKNFKMNANVAGEISDLNLATAKHIKSVNYPSILMLISENLLTGFEEFKVTKLSAHYSSPNVDLPPNIIIPVTNGPKCSIKFEDGTTFSLEYPVVVEHTHYEIIVPEGVELVLMSTVIDYEKTLAKYAPADRRLEIFARSML
jgi:hypothetical protein